MKKKNNLFKIIIFIIIFAVFFIFEKKIYKEYKAQKQISNYEKNQITTELENSFLLRKKYFYTDKTYLKNFNSLVEKSSKKGEE